jgi:hypothetical protein
VIVYESMMALVGSISIEIQPLKVLAASWVTATWAVEWYEIL